MPDKFEPMKCIVADEDGHWYIIPYMEKANWEEFCEGAYNDDEEHPYKLGISPDYAKEIDGPQSILFIDYDEI